MDVEQDDVRIELLDQRNGLCDARGLAHDLDGIAQLGPHAGEEELVVVDQHDATFHGALRGRRSSTSVPSPRAVTIVALPPARSSRPSIDSAMPRRSAGTAVRSKPDPRSWTKTDIVSSVTSA